MVPVLDPTNLTLGAQYHGAFWPGPRICGQAGEQQSRSNSPIRLRPGNRIGPHGTVGRNAEAVLSPLLEVAHDETRRVIRPIPGVGCHQHAVRQQTVRIALYPFDPRRIQTIEPEERNRLEDAQ